MQTIIDTLSSAYAQLFIFLGLIALFLDFRRRYGNLSSALSWLRTGGLALIFLYLLWNWSGLVNPSLQGAAVFLMFLINLSMLHNLIVIRCEHGYRQALQFYVHQAQDKDLYDTVWRSGKTYYAARYFFQSLISGKSPRYFIHLIASEEIPKDTQKALADHGVEIHPIAFQTLIAFLNHRLGTDEFLPAEFKTMLTEVITSLSQHAWVADQVNQFLEMAFHDPERLYKFTETMTAPAPPAEPTP